ncbi:hypothetical protein [Bifidobacterium saguinibicoloris]|uniref:hypothetical protein n=1 Tax=Bifidobacterium saguinibicoloris TaxID=2834433 RepID=UPI001F2E2295|nr:hypothetical protein [Bifidobacterium saguinibicoloris]
MTTFGDLAREHEGQEKDDKKGAVHGQLSAGSVAWNGTNGTAAGYGSRGNESYRRGASIDTDTSAADSGSFGWAVLGFFVPLVGFILFFVWRNSRPSNAHRCRNGAIAGMAANIILGLVLRAVEYAAMQSLDEQITTSQSASASSGSDSGTTSSDGSSSADSSDTSDSDSSASSDGSTGSSAPVASDAYKPQDGKEYYSYDRILIDDGYPNGISPSDPTTIAAFEKILREDTLPLYGFDPISDQPAKDGGVDVGCDGVKISPSINNGYSYTIKFNYGDGTITYTNWYYPGSFSTPVATKTWTLDVLRPCGATSSAVSSIPAGVPVTETYYNQDGSVDRVEQY